MQLLLRNKNCVYSLVRHLDEFYLTPAEHATDAARPAESDSFPVDKLHSVVISGTTTGEQIFLYIGSRERRFALAEDTTEEVLDTIFAGVERIQTTSGLESHVREPDWRESLQHESRRKKIRIIGIGLNIFAFVSAYNMLSEHDELLNMGRLFPIWTILATATMVILLTMFVTMPQYFTLDLWKHARKEIGCTAKVTDLKLLFPIMIFGCCNIMRDYTSWFFVLALVAALTLLLVWLACKVCRALREDQLQRWIFAAMLAVVLFNTIACVNDFANPDRYRVKGHRIISTDYTRIPGSRTRPGNRTIHYCTVATPSGREIKISIGKYQYETAKPGDWVVAYIGTGALGIEYGYNVIQSR